MIGWYDPQKISPIPGGYIVDFEDSQITMSYCKNCNTAYSPILLHKCAPELSIRISPEEKIEIAHLEAELIEDGERFEALEKRINALEIEQQTHIELSMSKNKKPTNWLFWFVLLSLVAVNVLILSII